MAILLKNARNNTTVCLLVSFFFLSFYFQPLNAEESLEITARHFDRLNTLLYILGDKNDVSILWILRLNRKGRL